MAGGQERILRRRIKSIKSTQKITKAMELIAASQIVRAQGRIAASRPYQEGMARIVLETVLGDPAAAGRLLGTPEDLSKVLVLGIVADRGLCGGYNTSVFRATERLIAAHAADRVETRLVTVGKKAQGYFRFRGQDVEQSFIGMSERPSFADARRVAAAAITPFVNGEVDQVVVVSTRFISAGTQRVEVRQLLPLVDPRVGEQKENDEHEPGESRNVAPTRSRQARLHRVRARCRHPPRGPRPPGGRDRDLRRTARGFGLGAHRPSAGHGRGHRKRRRAHQEVFEDHEPCPPGRHHHRDHGDRRRCRGAAGRVRAATRAAS